MIRFITPSAYFLALAVSTGSGYVAAEDLLQVYELARQNDHQYKADIAKYNASREGATIARGALLPQITANASVAREEVDASSTSPQQDGKTDTDTTSVGVSLRQSLLNFNAINSYRSSKINTSAAEAQLAADEQSLIIRSAQAYFDVLRAVDTQRTAQAEEKSLATQLEQTKQRYEVGLISINDVYETQAAYDTAVAGRLTADVAVGLQLENLAILTGQYHNRIASLADDFTASYPEPNNNQDWITAAQSNNLSLKVSKLTADAAEYGAKAARGNRYPELTGSLSYGRSERETGGDSSVDTDANSAEIRLDLSVPLYSGGSLSASERQAVQQQIQARELFLSTQRSTIQSTRSLFLSVTTDIARIKARKQAIVSRQSALEATQAGYDAGTRDVVDVVNAQSNLFNAQRDYYTALYDYIINTLKLKEVAGTLSVADLEALNGRLQTERDVGF